MSAQSDFVAALQALLLQATTPDTNAIKAAETQLQEAFKNPLAIQALYHIAIQGDKQVKQSAANELRKRILSTSKGNVKGWSRVDQDTRQSIKSDILDKVVGEQDNKIRHTLSRVIAAIGILEVPEGSWPELFPWLWAAAADANPSARETAVFTIFALIDTLADDLAKFSSYLEQLLQLFSTTINDPQSLEVRVITVRALGRISDYIDPDQKDHISTFQNVIPAIVDVTSKAIEAEREDAVTHCFDTIESISYSDSPLITPVIGDLVQFLLHTGSNKNVDDDYRLPSLSNLLLLIRHKKNKIQSLGLAQSMIEPLFLIAAEEEPEDFADECPARTALRCIDNLANNLPPNQVVDPVFALCQNYASSQDPGMRKAAIASLGMTFEGCSIYIEPNLGQIWPFVEQCLRDPSPVVRQAACTTLSYICDVLGESAAKHHATLLPIVFDLLNDPATQRNALGALDSLLENLAENIIQYLPTLMERLLDLLSNVPMGSKGTIVGAIGSAAHASKDKFVPYFEKTMSLITPLLLLKGPEEEEISVRGVAQDTVGTLAEAVGKDLYRPYFTDIMNNALDAVTLNVPNLRECSFIYFSAMSRVYKEEFGEYLHTIMPLILASLNQSELGDDADFSLTSNGFTAAADAAGGAHLGSSTSAEGGDDVDFEDVDDDDDALPNVSSDIALEKEVAVDALGEFFNNTKQHFLPFIPNVIECLKNLSTHFYEGIRGSAINTLLQFIITANKMAAGHVITHANKFTPGLNPAPLDQHVKELVDIVMPCVMEAWEQEDEREVVQSICEGLSNTILQVGPAVFVPTYLDTLCERSLAILECKAPCQIQDDGDELVPSGEQSQSEWDAYLIRSAAELVGAIARALGSDFAQALPTFLPAIINLADPKRPNSQGTDRSNAIGVLSDIVDGMKQGITPFTETFADIFLRTMKDSELDVRGTAAYAFGLLVQYSSVDLSSHFMAFLSDVQPILENPTDTSDANQARDNASGAIGRLMHKNPQAVPVDQLLPRLLNHVPVKEDEREIQPLVEAFISLIQIHQNQTAIQEIDRILGVFRDALTRQAAFSSDPSRAEDTPPLKDEALQQTLSFLRSLPADKLQSSGLSQLIS